MPKIRDGGEVFVNYMLIPFTDNDKNDYYRLFNTSEPILKKVIKEALTNVSDVAKFRLVMISPVSYVSFCVLIELPSVKL